MQYIPPSSLERWQMPFWFTLFIAGSVIFSLSFACATPFSAFAAAAALWLSRKTALLFVGLTWLANQTVGYAFLGYPQTAESFTWGAVIGMAALLATYAGCILAERNAMNSTIKIMSIVFVAAVGVYQLVMLVAALSPLGGIENNNFEVVSRVVMIDIIAFIGLLAANSLGKSAGILPEKAHRKLS